MELVETAKHELVEQIKATIDQLDLDGLNEKQRNFVLQYNLSPIKAAEAAGYGQNVEEDKKSNYLRATVVRLLSVPKIREAIDTLKPIMEAALVCDTIEVQAVLSGIVRDEGAKRADVINAAKLLLASKGDLSERILIEQRGKIEHEIKPVFANIPAGPLGSKLTQPQQVEVIEVPVENYPDDSNTDDIEL